VKSRDLRSVAALQDTSVEWLGLLTLTVVSTCMGDCQEHQPVRKHHICWIPPSTCDIASLSNSLAKPGIGGQTISTPRGLQVLGIKALTRATIKSRSADRNDNEGRKFTHMRSLHTKF
jgi:hypothetical protein